MGISTSRLCDRRAYRGRIDGEYRMRAPSVASRSRTRGWRTATGPMPVMISRSGRWPWRTTRCWPVSVLRSACFARNSASSASTAWVSSACAPLRRISVRESVKAPGGTSLTTLVSDTAYHSFIGEVEALNTTTIRRLTRSRRHQLLAIAQDSDGQTLDGSKHNYTLTFSPGLQPPVNSFWSLTMYDGKTQLLIENPINRYLINSPMLSGMKTNPDGSLTFYIQNKSPGADKEANWLPAPDGPIYLVMRLYWPKATAPSILPPGEGTWQPPGVKRVS